MPYSPARVGGGMGVAGFGLALLVAILAWRGVKVPNGIFYGLLALSIILILGGIVQGIIAACGGGLRRVRVALISDPNSPPNERWWNVKVHNPNREGVECYGKIRTYRILHSDGNPLLPKPGTKLPWRASPRGDRRQTANIQGMSDDYLDFAFCQAPHERYFTPQVAHMDEPQPLTGQYGLPPGQYEAEIEIGAEQGDMRMRVLTIQVTYSGGLRLEAQIVRSR